MSAAGISAPAPAPVASQLQLNGADGGGKSERCIESCASLSEDQSRDPSSERALDQSAECAKEKENLAQMPERPSATDTKNEAQQAPADQAATLRKNAHSKHLGAQPQLCHACKRTLSKSPELISVAGQTHRWHPECFTCSVCNEPMDKRQSCHLLGEQIVCRADYIKLTRNSQQEQQQQQSDGRPAEAAAAAVKCARCGWPIGPLDWVRRAASYVYHLACFNCDICFRQLNTGDQFTLDVGQQQQSPSVKLMCRYHFSPNDAELKGRDSRNQMNHSDGSAEIMPALQNIATTNADQSSAEAGHLHAQLGTMFMTAAATNNQGAGRNRRGVTTSTLPTARLQHDQDDEERPRAQLLRAFARDCAPPTMSPKSTTEGERFLGAGPPHGACDSPQLLIIDSVEPRLNVDQNMTGSGHLNSPGTSNEQHYLNLQLGRHHQQQQQQQQQRPQQARQGSPSISASDSSLSSPSSTSPRSMLNNAVGSLHTPNSLMLMHAASQVGSATPTPTTTSNCTQSSSSSSTKSKRVRTTFTDDQLSILQTHFQIDSNPDGQDLERIATITGLSKRVTQVWFQNSRARQKKYLVKKKPSSLHGVPVNAQGLIQQLAHHQHSDNSQIHS